MGQIGRTSEPAAITARAESFSRIFAQLWGARDVAGLAALMAEDAEMLSLTGGWAEGRAEIEALLASEFAGAFGRSRLVSGKTRLRTLGPGTVVLQQRFVLSGLLDGEGRDIGRTGAMLIAVLVAGPDGWQAVTLQFSAVDP
ncbi:DUF4440 domain-containing protein [Pseudorhodobacter turbinis]|uniref:DUF4440 domain-containing protein n=2 Tax=Pseudorhodobacter turbinis TaxID=2500533 RepID=A0A4P8EI83_9RHOB|nr:DUF4440 domain-containing protein [Pseudorhodobacter turbinis]